MNHAEEAFSVVLPADHQPTEVMKPSNKSLHSPPPAVAPQGTAILSRLPALPAMWSDHRDAIALGQISIPAVAVAGVVPDQSCGKGVEESLSEDSSTSWLSCGEALSILMARGSL
jgi:hypothetical protein